MILQRFVDKADIRQIFKDAGVTVLLADATKKGSIGSEEMLKYGNLALPLSVGYWQVNGVTSFTRIDLSSHDSVTKSFKKVLGIL